MHYFFPERQNERRVGGEGGGILRYARQFLNVNEGNPSWITNRGIILEAPVLDNSI